MALLKNVPLASQVKDISLPSQHILLYSGLFCDQRDDVAMGLPLAPVTAIFYTSSFNRLLAQ
jgi:hypothetical protein